jgi:amidohydrolase
VSTLDREALKQAARDEVDRRATQLIDIAHRIHARPELGHQEHFAHDLLTTALADAGLEVEPRAYGLGTAFAARAGTDGPLLAVLCEYDALPDIGHACGHNVIAAAGLGAGLASAAVAAEAGGRVVVLGTPSEEGPPQGKAVMAERGAFDEVQAALMVHPAGADLLSMNALAAAGYQVDYYGVPAHAAAAPEHGRNALDAAVFGYTAVAALRQHILPTERVHGIFTKAGAKANIVPHHARALWVVRSPTSAGLAELEPRVLACLEAGALATGCRMESQRTGGCEDIMTNPVLIDLYVANMAALGRTPGDPRLVGAVVGSTDMGQVSHLVPSIHPMIALAPPEVSIHDPEFAVHAASPAADRAVLDAAKALAMTMIDMWVDEGVRTAAREAFAARS